MSSKDTQLCDFLNGNIVLKYGKLTRNQLETSDNKQKHITPATISLVSLPPFC